MSRISPKIALGVTPLDWRLYAVKWSNPEERGFKVKAGPFYLLATIKARA